MTGTFLSLQQSIPAPFMAALCPLGSICATGTSLFPLKVTWMLRKDLDLHVMALAGDRCKPCP